MRSGTGDKIRSGKSARAGAARSPAAAKPRRPGGAVAIVGIGASAGGLEALEQFFGHVPASSGLAFVVVQHLDPTRKGIMPELLQRTTTMKVAQVKDRVRVQRDHVYVIPPNKDLSILGGALHLLDPSTPRGLRLPIDFFFRALADDQRERSVGVILSGMGTDGTLGLRRMKEQGGVVLVQEPASAKFDSMPRSAIETGLADVVAPADALPARLLAFLRLAVRVAPVEPGRERHTQAGLEKIVLLLRDRSGHDFSGYKKSTLYRRIERRMALHQIEDIASYVRYLQEDPPEQELLFNELLIGVTRFFRDEAAWVALREKVFPALFSQHPKGGALRAWAAGCTTGEEAYSLAVVFLEAVERERRKVRYTLQVFATDLDRNAIEKARRGVYPVNISSDVSPGRLRRFFVKEESGNYRVRQQIRDMVTFAPHDLIRDAPFTRLDILVCRNVLIYLETELQRRLIPLFHYSLRPGGLLFLGNSETVGTEGGLFAPLDAKLRLYVRNEVPLRLGQPDFSAAHFPASPAQPLPASQAKTVPNLQSLADELILRQFSPATVLVSDKGELLYLNGRTSKYLEAPAGKVNLNIFAMAGEGLRASLRAAFQRAARQQRPVTTHGTTAGATGSTSLVDVTVVRLRDPEALRGTFLVVFRDVASSVASGSARRARSQGEHPRLTDMQREVRQLHADLRSTREDMQSSQEELRSANEEMQSTNEELQSTNEELTTSKEEMQSMNEELQTVNAELQAKVDELSRASNDMKNLLDSTNIATIFLDGGLRVRRFTSQASRLMNLIPGDVGRPITDLASDLLYPGLGPDVKEVLRTLVRSENQVTTATGRSYTARVMPYRTLDDVVDGVVITFTDVTEATRVEARLRESRERFAKLLANLPADIALFDENGVEVPRDRLLTRIADSKEVDFSSWKVALARGPEPSRLERS
ncbi:MAG: chemotaxis protein CheB [Myxococcaceae bacterium]